MVTGSAPIDLAVLNFLKVCFCCPIMEGYGLTETCGASSITAANDPVAGHVGGPIECVKFRLRDVPEMNYLSTDKPYPRGEIQMSGCNVTKGYYKREDKTKEAYDTDGWFCSGDVGLIYPNGAVKIIDRAKNIFKLSQGEYIAPEKLENVYVQSSLVAQICIYGDSLRNNVVAICAVEEPEVKKWGRENGKGEDVAALCKTQELKDAIKKELFALAAANKFSGLEKPYGIWATAEPFSVENNLLTPTFKLKRNIVKDYYKAEIEQMYQKIADDDKKAGRL